MCYTLYIIKQAHYSTERTVYNMTHKLIIKDANNNIVSTMTGSKDALSDEAKRLRKQYKRMGYNYKISVVKR